MATHFQTDVLIVGGGPAGASAALSLLRYSDLKVMIVEASAFHSVRVGEQVSPGLFDLLHYMDISKEDFEPGSFVRGYSSLAAWGSDRIVSRDSIFSTQEENYQLDREKFDLLLIEKAVERGAVVLPRAKCNRYVQEQDGSWTISGTHKTNGEFSIRSTYLVDATGRQSSVCRQLGVDVAHCDELVAVGAFLECAPDSDLKQDILLETTEYGWWYCATLPNNRLTVTLFADAACVKEKQLQKTENWMSLLAATSHIKRKIPTSVTCSEPWTRNAFSQLADTSSQTNFLAVGDAAAAFDPISSMGIGFAVSSGCHAAHALMRAQTDNAATFSEYGHQTARIFNDYLATRNRFYGLERRWSEAPFWKNRTTTSR